MWFLRVVVGLSLTHALIAQALRLENKVERPLVYLAQRAPDPGGGDVLAALGDPGLLALLGLAPDGNRDVKEVDSGRVGLHEVQDLLSRLSDSSEMALVGLLPLTGRQRPLLVFHSQLTETGAEKLRGMLEGAAPLRAHRELHGDKVYIIAPTDGFSPAVEAALRGRDLIVSNDAATMERVLDRKTQADGGFATRPEYQALRRQVEVPAGSVLLYADWEVLQPRLETAWLEGLAPLLRGSGIVRPEHLMLVLRPAGATPSSASPASSPVRGAGPRPQTMGIATTLLLRHASGSHRFTTGHDDPGALTEWQPDGWLDLIEPGRPQKLLPGLPAGGLATVLVRIAPDKILPVHPGRNMRLLQARLFRSARELGIDLRAQILRRLGTTAAIQLVWPDNGAPGLALAVDARSRRDAELLFQDLEKAARESDSDAVVADRGSQRTVRLSREGAFLPIYLTVVQDALVAAHDRGVLERIRELAAPSRPARRRDEVLVQRLRSLGIQPGRQEVGGLVMFDLRGLAARFLANAGSNAASDPKDLASTDDPTSGLFGWHGGYFTLEKGLLRLEMFTELRDG